MGSLWMGSLWTERVRNTVTISVVRSNVADFLVARYADSLVALHRSLSSRCTALSRCALSRRSSEQLPLTIRTDSTVRALLLVPTIILGTCSNGRRRHDDDAAALLYRHRP